MEEVLPGEDTYDWHDPAVLPHPMTLPHVIFSPEQVKACIADLELKADLEEREGCFLLAETHWRDAFRIASYNFPRSVHMTRLAHGFGLFLSRFSTYPREPLHYLRMSLEHSAEASLELARMLIEAEECEEAERVLRDTQVSVRAKTLLGKALLRSGNVLCAEESLRATVKEARSVCSDELGEALTALGEVLFEEGKLDECREILQEAHSLLSPSRAFFDLQVLFARLFELSEDSEEENTHFSLLLEELRGAHPYTLARVLRIWARTNKDADSKYLRALLLYRGVREKSGYVFACLSEFLKAISSARCQLCTSVLAVGFHAELHSLLPHLPAASTLWAFESVDGGTHAHELALEKLLAVAEDSAEEVLSGKALLALFSSGFDNKKQCMRRVEAYARRYPASVILADIFRSGQVYRRRALSLHLSPSSAAANCLALARDKKWELSFRTNANKPKVYSEVFCLLQQALTMHRTVAPVSWRTAHTLLEMAKIYREAEQLIKAEECCREALGIASAISLESSPECTFVLGTILGDSPEADECFHEAVETLSKSSRSSSSKCKVLAEWCTFFQASGRRELLGLCFCALRCAPLKRFPAFAHELERGMRSVVHTERELKLVLALLSGVRITSYSQAAILTHIRGDASPRETSFEYPLPAEFVMRLSKMYRSEQCFACAERVLCFDWTEHRIDGRADRSIIRSFYS